MKKLITICLFMAVSIGYSQGHQSGGKWCCPFLGTRCDGVGTYLCPACAKTEKAEREAKATEDKRRAVAHAEKVKSDKIARDLAYKKQQKELAEKNKSTEVFVTMPKSTAIKNTTPDKKTESKGMVRNYFYTQIKTINNQSIDDMYFRYQEFSNYFLINNEKKFTNNEFKTCIGVYTNEYLKYSNFPPNIGIVVLNESFTDRHGKSIQISDLIDSKGNRILNDNSISIIIHFADDYFIAFRGMYSSVGTSNERRFFADSGEPFIYNLKTKQKILIPRYTIDGTEMRWYEFDNCTCLPLIDREIDTNKYKARFKSKLSSGTWKTEYILYYITKDGKIEKQFERWEKGQRY
jgi:uncharacterized Zn finger protein (UPF0148 family)